MDEQKVNGSGLVCCVPFDTATLVILVQQEIKGSVKSIELISN
jgi:hypothetical protein